MGAYAKTMVHTTLSVALRQLPRRVGAKGFSEAMKLLDKSEFGFGAKFWRGMKLFCCNSLNSVV